tara:strand:- start:1165 stop:2052 length:888 start_codon:yes stop_codon:yes gene_type:complete
MRFRKNKEDTRVPHDDLVEAEAFASNYCNPDDGETIANLDLHARETAWALLQRVKELEAQSCLCDECATEVEEEPEPEELEDEYDDQEEPEELEDEYDDQGESQTLGVDKNASGSSTIENAFDVAEKSSGIIKKVTKGGVAAAAAASTQTASAATAATGLTAFLQESTHKIATIGVAGTMSISSGAYFQAKTTKEKGTEIAVVVEQEHGIFSSLNDFAQVATGFQPFNTIVDYAENGYGDIKGKPVIASVTDATSSSVAPGTILSPEDLKTLGITFPPIKTPPKVSDVSGGRPGE